MAPSVEGPPIISSRALRWSDEEVSLVWFFCLLHFIPSGRRRRRRAVACLCFYDVPADGGRRGTSHTCMCSHGPTIRLSKVLHAIISLVSGIQFQCCSHLPSLPFHRFAIVSRAIQFQHVPFPSFRRVCACAPKPTGKFQLPKHFQEPMRPRLTALPSARGFCTNIISEKPRTIIKIYLSCR